MATSGACWGQFPFALGTLGEIYLSDNRDKSISIPVGSADIQGTSCPYFRSVEQVRQWIEF